MRGWRSLGEFAEYWLLLLGLLVILAFDLTRREPMAARALLAFAFGVWCLFQNYG